MRTDATPTPSAGRRLRGRRVVGALAAIASSAAVASLGVGAARAAPDAVALPGAAAYPENVAAAPDGTLYVGSFVDGGVIRVRPGATEGEVWIAPAAYGTRSTFGTLPDARTNTLWVCSNDLSAIGVAGPGQAEGSALKGFDLATGAGKTSVPFPGGPSICNDLALGPDGSVYATDTRAPRILRLRPGGSALEVFASDPMFDGGPGGAGLDGIAFGADGDLYVNTFTRGELFRVAVVRDGPGAGTAGRVTRIETSRPLVLADGMRLEADGSFLLVEGGGRLDRVTVVGDRATVETIRDGIPGGPTGVARVGDVAWVSVGQLGLVLDPALKGGRPSLPFRLYAVPLPPR